MKTKFLPVLLIWVFGVSAIQSTEAAVVSVKSDPFAGFSLDIDGDGAAELRRFKPKIGAVAFDLTADGMGASSSFNFPSKQFQPYGFNHEGT